VELKKAASIAPRINGVRKKYNRKDFHAGFEWKELAFFCVEVF
jgi:hypothetical protein